MSKSPQNSQQPIELLQLYARDMNVYGDWGNVLVLKRRLEWHGYAVNLTQYNPGDVFPDQVDLIVGGGGQDSGQSRVQSDLLQLESTLARLAKDGTPMLMICGLYQLFGHYFKTADGQDIRGIGLLDIVTEAGPSRLTGNVVVDSTQFGQLVGYENHSGQTTLGQGVQPLGQVTLGAGNNGRDNSEGAVYKNVIGSYMHGSLLPKNPNLADWLIKQAVTRKLGDFKAAAIDDRLAEAARDTALRLPR